MPSWQRIKVRGDHISTPADGIWCSLLCASSMAKALKGGISVETTQMEEGVWRKLGFKHF